MSTLKHLAHGAVVYLATLVPTLTATHVTVDRSLLLSLVPGFIAALASSLGDNVTQAQVTSALGTVDKVLHHIQTKPAATK